MNSSPIVRGNDLYQIVDFHTRGDAILDLMLTKHTLKSHYNKLIPLSPIGCSDHVSVLWKPKRCCKIKNTFKIKEFQPFHDLGIQAFGLWIQNQDWNEVLSCVGTQDIAFDSYFPVKKISIHHRDKPWVSTYILKIISERQAAFASNNQQKWRKLRNMVNPFASGIPKVLLSPITGLFSVKIR